MNQSSSQSPAHKGEFAILVILVVGALVAMPLASESYKVWGDQKPLPTIQSLGASHAVVASEWVRLDRKPEAKLHFIRCLQLSPGHLSARLKLANIYYTEGNPDVAKSQLRHILTDRQATATAHGDSAHLMMSRLLYEEGDLKGAVSMLKEVSHLPLARENRGKIEARLRTLQTMPGGQRSPGK
jgi:ATP/maltotriose-dependent transcriptional regulator MalT